MKRVITCVAAIFFAACVHAQQQPKQETTAAQFPENIRDANIKLSYKIIEAPNKTFGYDVYAEHQLLIHQTSIPALSGNKGFKTKADAEKVAKLVIEKIKNGEMPPTVTIEELKKLKVVD